MTDFVSVDLMRATVILVAPLLLAALGEMLCERAGVLNLSVEGQMTLAAATTFVVVFAVGWTPGAVLAGVVLGMLVSVFVALLLSVLCLSIRADQISVGLALLVFSFGAAALLYGVVVGSPLSSPRIATLPQASVWGLAEIPLLGRILFQHNLLVYVGLLIVVPVAWLVLRTRAGLLIRASGENPRSVDSLGLPLQRIRYSAVLAGGALIGMAGAYFPLVLAGGFANGIIGGRGWLAIMVVILGRWRPLPILGACVLFGYLDSLQFQLAVTRHGVPTQFLQALPYVVAIVVIATVYKRTQFPAWLTRTYSREAR